MKNVFHGLISRLNTAEKRINEFEDSNRKLPNLNTKRENKKVGDKKPEQMI